MGIQHTEQAKESPEKWSIPEHWLERIYLRIREIFGDNHVYPWEDNKIGSYVKSMWLHGLYGLTAEDIGKGMEGCRKLALRGEQVPDVNKFWHLAKGIPYFVPRKQV